MTPIYVRVCERTKNNLRRAPPCGGLYHRRAADGRRDAARDRAAFSTRLASCAGGRRAAPPPAAGPGGAGGASRLTHILHCILPTLYRSPPHLRQGCAHVESRGVRRRPDPSLRPEPDTTRARGFRASLRLPSRPPCSELEGCRSCVRSAWCLAPPPPPASCLSPRPQSCPSSMRWPCAWV